MIDRRSFLIESVLAVFATALPFNTEKNKEDREKESTITRGVYNGRDFKLYINGKEVDYSSPSTLVLSNKLRT